MKRVIVVILLIAFLAAVSGAADLRHVRLSGIEHLDVYWEAVQFVANNQHNFRDYVPDDYWDARFSKQEYGERLLDLYRAMTARPEESNQEYLLLRAMISDFMYNLDVPDRFDATVNHYREIDALPEHDYRARWMLGMFYAGAAKPIEAIEQFMYVADRLPEERLHPDFWRDYGYATSLCYMRQTAIKLYEKYFLYSNLSATDYSLYGSLTESFIEPDPLQDIPTEKLFTFLERESGVGMLSRPLGLWLPLELHWGLRLSGLEDGMSAVLFTPDPILTEDQTTVSYTIAVFSYVDRSSVADDWTELFESVRTVPHVDLDRYVLYEYEDDSKYENMGGGHGRFAIVRSPVPEFPGIAIEAPSMLPPTSEPRTGLHYVPFQEEFSRIPAELTHVVFLDASSLVYPQALPVFMDFLSEMISE